MRHDDTKRSARYVLGFGIISGVIYAYMTLTTNVVQLGLASRVYYAAATAALAGENFYLVTPPSDAGYYFIYPPIVVTAFYPHALLGNEAAAFYLQTLINIVVCFIMTIILWESLERRSIKIDVIDRGVIGGFVFLSVYGISQFIQGQTTLWLAMAFVVGFEALERDRPFIPGIAFAMAALIKLFPAALGLWLLRRGDLKETVVAIVTGIGGVLLGLVFLGREPTEYYFRRVLADRFRHTTFEGMPDPSSSITSAQRQVAVLLDGNPEWVTPVIIAIFMPIIAWLYVRIDSEAKRMATVLGTILAVLLIMPLQPLYFSLIYYPIIVLLYTLRPGRSRWVLIVGIVFSYALFGYDIVENIVGAVPVSDNIASIILDIAGSIFTFILPPTMGMWIMFSACLLIHYDDI